MLNFADRASLLPGLRPASWRGKTFWVIDIEHEIGRRIHATLYPGLDLKTFDDTGPLDGPIDVSGLVIGDDYVQQAEALHAAFRKAGSGTFIHPWRGPIDCVLSRPARISFASDELRVARIDVTFEPTGEEVGVGGLLGGFLGGLVGGLFSSIAGIIGAVAGVVGAVLGVVNTVLSVAVMAVSIWNFGVAAVAGVIGIARAIVGATREAPRLLPIAVSLSARVALASSLTGRATVATALARVLSEAPAEIGAVFRPSPRSGVGVAASAATASTAPISATASVEPQPRRGAELMLRIAATLGTFAGIAPASASGSLDAGRAELAAIAADPDRSALLAELRRPASLTEKLIYLAAEAGFVAEAVSLATEISFDSRQDALVWQDRLDTAISASCERASVLAFAAPAEASALWQALEKLRGVVAIDLSEIIGRLPAAERIAPPRGSTWLLAQHLAGDDPSRVVETLHDIRRRNGLRHPAVLGSGPVEVLR